VSQFRGALQAYTLADLAKARDGSAKKAFEADFHGRALVVDARLGGLDEDGLLNPNEQFCNFVADKDPWTWTGETGADHQPLVKFRIEDRDDIDDDEWKLRRSFTVKPADDPSDAERLYIFKWSGDAETEDDRSILRKRQDLQSHSEDVQRCVEYIATKVAPSSPFISKMLGLAAKMHDQGKARELWQQAMGMPKAPADPNWPYAKTDGRGVNLNLLKVGDKTFRHEFASVMEAKKCDAFEEFAGFGNLVLHLIAAHHGFARPYIFAFDPKFPPSETEANARDIVLRYARLLRRWGPWGLAWWEALLRAADQMASRNNGERPATCAKEST
jgi:CRISPR-associated endonuclease/helicase Cas3